MKIWLMWSGVASIVLGIGIFSVSERLSDLERRIVLLDQRTINPDLEKVWYQGGEKSRPHVTIENTFPDTVWVSYNGDETYIPLPPHWQDTRYWKPTWIRLKGK